MNRRLAATLIVLLVTAASSPQAAIYRWMDDQGVVHYSETPPPAENVDRGTRITTDGPATGATAQARQRLRAMEEQLEAMSKQRQEAATEAAEAQREEERLASNCTAARKNLTNLENRRQRRIVDDAGNVTALTEEDRQQRMAEARTQIAENCR